MDCLAWTVLGLSTTEECSGSDTDTLLGHETANEQECDEYASSATVS